MNVRRSCTAVWASLLFLLNLLVPLTAAAQDGEYQILQARYGTSSNQTDVTYRLRSRVVNDAISARVDNNLAGTEPAQVTLGQLPGGWWR